MSEYPDDDLPPIKGPAPEAPRFYDRLFDWWREATGQTSEWHLDMSRRRAFVRRIFLWSPVAVVAVLLAGGAGFYAFTGWRARDLAAKALENVESGNARAARLQIFSAQSLRPNDHQMKRAVAMIESRLGHPEAVRMWEDVGAETDLSEEELDVRAEAMALHGDDSQFTLALTALEKRGGMVRAAELRSLRSLRRGDIQKALDHARAAVRSDNSPRLRLHLLQLLAARHGVFLEGRARAGVQDAAAATEMSALIDGLVDTAEGESALALGLEAPYFPSEQKAAWAAAVWRNLQPSNPALLPAADFLASSGAEEPEDLYNKLNLLYIGAPLPRQAAFARWLLRRGMNERVLVTASDAEAAQNEDLFSARASALGTLGRWEEVYRLASAPSKAPDGLRLLVKARAARELGRQGEAEESARSALRSAAAQGYLAASLELADEHGMRQLADEALVELSGNPALADVSFRLARDRFSRRGQFATLDRAHAAARRAAPSAASIRNYGVYLELLGGRAVDPVATAAAASEDPTDLAARYNHALALLRADRGKEALAVFEDLDVFVDQLPPGLRAVSAAVFHAAGDRDAFLVLPTIDPNLLTPAEYALIAPLKTFVNNE